MRINRKVMTLFLILIVVAAIAIVATRIALSPRSNNPSGQSPIYEGTALQGSAPDFLLFDQNGSPVALSDYHGRIVVLTFLDSRCKDVCPLMALQFRQAFEQLKQSGTDVSRIVFLGVNVNTEANSSEDVTKFTKEQGLDSIPTWHFLTGTAAELEPVWKVYAISVTHDEKSGEIVHTSGIYLLDQKGQKRWYISFPIADQGDSATAQKIPTLSDLLVKQIQRLLVPMSFQGAPNG
jgi:cytochrome oxidase Cu insertion factor (SCO1/SenC/PrrC family)